MQVSINKTGNFVVDKKAIKELFSILNKVFPIYLKKEISIAFVSDQIIKNINFRYRKINKPTDVLSFAEIDSKDKIPNDNSLGEIIISYPYTKRQAKKN